ncbi:7-cyano-7-deazaguanine synthase QueC [Legionella cardiaca]|uniref:7-cyano-7-deazaguanine synthase n=1 Tax=Legionella cardiaca TaxID=1071983 RepID=A0ABY8AQJ6_9GAMM|nr:7-cyano-7-deazaguanine synthase QueC [Legionella cardiaca]WED42793.1 7-cyano-7-deazaguanine synthase QueC [Legionella cardiaca]
MKKAVILLSGGLDSATCLAIAKAAGFSCYALSFMYGQRHTAELTAAKRVAEHLQAVEHRIVNLDIGQFGGSALTDTSMPVPEYSGTSTIPITYVPARNTIFLSMALAFAESIGAHDIFIGASSIDYSGYPDCRPEFMAAFEKLANLATKEGVEGHAFKIHAPLQFLTKAETILKGTQLGVDYSLTISCYQATEDGTACGTCDSCTFRKQGFKSADLPDPTRYQ